MSSIDKFIKSSGTSKGSSIDRLLNASKTKKNGVSNFITPKKKTTENVLNTEEGLQDVAEKAGLGKQAQEILNPKPKLSLLQRLGAGLSAFETGNAVYTGMEKGMGEGLKTYGGSIFSGLKSAVTGEDVGQSEKKTYKDVVEKMGVENGIAKFGLGFLGDVLLDPSTYLGGAVVKKGISLAGKTGSKTLSIVGKVAPKVETGIRMAGEGVTEALGKAFKFGYGTSKGVAEKGLETMSELGKAKEGIVKSNIARLGTGTLSSSQQDELVEKLLAGKRAEYAGKTAGEAIDIAKSSDPLVQKTITEQMGRTQKFAKSAGIDDPFTVYFPGIKKDKIKNFFESTKALRVGSEGYKKEFKNLLKDEEMVRNPAEAFARREFDIAKDNIIRGQLKGMIGDVGKPLNAFKTEDEALKAGYKLVKEKGMFGKPMGYLLENDKKFLDNLISPEFATIDAIAKHTGFDAITSLFKRSVTGLFAPFHVRNYASGLIQNYEVLGPKALDPRNIATGQKIAYKIARNKTFGKETLKIGAKEYSINQIVKPFAKRFGTSSSYIADIGDATADTSKLIPTLGQKLNPLAQENIAFRSARAVGNFIETQQKATAYVTALRSGKSVKESLGLATKAGFDYRALTPFESKIMRRIMPFYSFTRKNLELQLSTLGENPQRISNVMKAMRDAQGDVSPEEKQFLPDFVKEGFFTKVGNDKYGQPEFITQYGTPIEQFAGQFGENQVLRMISQFNPILKAPIELGIGKDSFRKQDLKDVYNAKEYKMAPQFIKDLLKIKPVEKPVYRNNIKTDEKKIDYVADPERLLIARSLFTSRGVSYLDKMFGGDLEGFAKALNLASGVKAYPIDIESSKYFKERDAKRELQDLLQRYGVIKTMEIPYVPKK
ncbi:MAG: hypothetical protein WC788_08035 [Candidatus Paceibacterota bacterium]|jgi:hypothetical protein